MLRQTYGGLSAGGFWVMIFHDTPLVAAFYPSPDSGVMRKIKKRWFTCFGINVSIVSGIRTMIIRSLQEA